jgi:signal transduction histidine kinase
MNAIKTCVISGSTKVPGGLRGAKPTITELVGHIERLAETERTALAGAIQNDIGESLRSAIMDLTWVEQHIASSSDEYKRRLKRAGESLANCLTLERRLIEGLRPSLLDNIGLFAALRWHMRTTCVSAGVTCTIEFPDPEPVFQEHVPIVLFRIVVEALETLLADKFVSTVDLQVTAGDDVFSVSVTSDAVSRTICAADPNAPYALLRLQHRAATLGGGARLVGPTEHGTRITARFAFGRVLRVDPVDQLPPPTIAVLSPAP